MNNLLLLVVGDNNVEEEEMNNNILLLPYPLFSPIFFLSFRLKPTTTYTHPYFTFVKAQILLHEVSLVE